MLWLEISTNFMVDKIKIYGNNMVGQEMFSDALLEIKKILDKKIRAFFSLWNIFRTI